MSDNTVGAAPAGTSESTRDVVFANNATADGSYTIKLNGNAYTLTISNNDTIADMADNLAAGIRAQDWYEDLPFTATSDTIDTVTFDTTGRVLGIQSQWAVYCINDDTISLPGTTTATLGAVSASAGAVPLIATLRVAVAAAEYDYTGWSNLDSVAVTEIETYLTAQNGPTVGYYQQAVLCSPDTYNNTLTLAQTNCNYREIQVGWTQTDNEYYCETVGRMVGLRSLKEAGDAAYPYNWEVLPGYRIHESPSSYPTPTNVENCLNNGITPIGVRSGNGAIVRSVTSYSRLGSNPDYSSLDTATVTVPHYIADDLKATMQVLFASKKMADDYTDPTETPRNVVTPKMVIDVIYRRLKIAQDLAIVSDVEPYTAQIDAEVDAVVAGRMNFECPVPVMNGLYVVAGNVRGF
jgi:phage tail sheath gpL-like